MPFNPTCPCHARPIGCCRNNPPNFFEMTSTEMRSYGEANNRPDLVIHSACIEHMERWNALSDEFEGLVQCHDYGTFPLVLREKIRTVNTFLLSSWWSEYYPFPEDDIFEEGRRLKEEVEAAREAARRGSVMALGDSTIVPFSGQGNRLTLNRGQSHRLE